MTARIERWTLLWLPVPILIAPLLLASAWAGSFEVCGNPRLYSLVTWCEESIAPGILELPGGLQILVAAGIAIVGSRRLRAWSS